MVTGKISSIKHDVTALAGKTMTTSLAAKGRTRYPGTGFTLMPFREMNGKYRTGLDEEAGYINSIIDSDEKKDTKLRIKANRERLEKATGLDLSATSKFWDYALYSEIDRKHIEPYKLVDGDNLFDFRNPHTEINFWWLSVHPRIASSLEAYQNGEYSSETQFYVYNEEVENDRNYHKKQIVNKAIVKLDLMSPDNRKKVARLMGLPVTDHTKEAQVYNLLDTILKQTEFKEGKYKGLNTVNMFLQFAQMNQGRLNVKDSVKQAVQLNIYRVKESGKIYEGDLEVAPSEEELVTKLTDDDHQDELLALDSKLNAKKIATT